MTPFGQFMHKIKLLFFSPISENVIKFIEEFLPKLEFSDFIYRYSWFVARYGEGKFRAPVDTNANFWLDPWANTLSPVNENGEAYTNALSAMGEAYDKPWHLEQYRPPGY